MKFSKNDGYQDKYTWVSGWFHGRRYNVVKLCDGWVLQDTRPNEPGYVFTRGRRTLYAAKILAEAYSIEGARKLIEIAAELERTEPIVKKSGKWYLLSESNDKRE